MKVDFFVLPMEGANMVLGIQWLEELGDVGFNFKDSFFTFSWGERCIN